MGVGGEGSSRTGMRGRGNPSGRMLVDVTCRTGGSGEQISHANTRTQRSCTEVRPLGRMMPVGCPRSGL